MTRNLAKSFLLMMYTLSASATTAVDFNVTLLPTDPKGPDLVESLARYEIYQTKNGQESLITSMEAHVGDCSNCTRGISINCGGEKDAPHRDPTTCRNLVKQGIGFRIDSTPVGPAVRIKNGSGFKISRPDGATEDVLRDGQPAVFLLSRPHDATADSLRILIMLRTRSELKDQATGIVPFRMDVPDRFGKICAENARTLTVNTVMHDPQTIPYHPVVGTPALIFHKAETWLAAPHDGVATYYVQIPMSNGWECDYQVEMAMHHGEANSQGICGLSAIKFRMCSK